MILWRWKGEFLKQIEVPYKMFSQNLKSSGIDMIHVSDTNSWWNKIFLFRFVSDTSVVEENNLFQKLFRSLSVLYISNLNQSYRGLTEIRLSHHFSRYEFCLMIVRTITPFGTETLSWIFFNSKVLYHWPSDFLESMYLKLKLTIAETVAYITEFCDYPLLMFCLYYLVRASLRNK